MFFCLQSPIFFDRIDTMRIKKPKHKEQKTKIAPAEWQEFIEI